MHDAVSEAVRAGMTDAEADVWEKVRQAASAYLALTESEPGHPMEREEICHAFHDIQARLTIRPFMRAATSETDEPRADDGAVCRVCGVRYRNKASYSESLSCLVFHAPGDCCHFQQERVDG